MHNPSKTYQELIEENSLLKQRLRELEQSLLMLKITDERASQEKDGNDQSIPTSPTEGIFHISADGRLLVANSALAHLLGYESIEDLFASVTNIEKLLFVAQETYSEYIRLVFEKKTVKAFETKVYRKDGSILWLSINSRLISDDLGNPTYIDGFVSDITENRKLRDELSAVMREQRIILDTANVGISLIRDRKQVWINRKTEEMFQYSKEELINQTTRKLYPSQEAYEQLGAAAYPILAQGMTYETVQELVRRDGSNIWVRYNGRAIDPHDLSQGTLWILEDITERKRIEEKLQRAYDELELRVADRTEALMLVNEELRTEIAERNQAEEALTKSEAKYSSYVKNAPDGVFIADEKGRYIEVNNAACLMTGFTEEELLQMSIPDLLSEESLEAGHAHFKTLTETGVSKGELQFKHKDGSKRWWFVDAVKLSEARFLGFTKDITERKRAEMRLQQITERFNVALYASKAGAWDWDIITGQVEWSSQMFDIFGLDPLRNKASFDTWERALHPQDVEIAGIRIDQALKQQAILNNDYRVLLPDGQICWINAVGQGEYNEQGNPIRMTGICMDITERKQTEEKLHEITGRLHLATASAKAGVWDWNLQTNGMIWDDRMLELYGLTHENFPGGVEAWEQGLHPDDSSRAVEECQAALRGERDFDTEFCVRRPDGTMVHIKANGLVLRDEKGQPLRMIGLNTDITERKHVEEEIKRRDSKYRELIEHAQDGIFTITVQGQFLFVNTKLCQILGYTLEECLRSNILDTYPDDIRPVGTQRLADLQSGQALRFERPMKRKDGGIVFVEAIAWKDSDG
ncbi:MAG: PAS domain S-box protein, partial [Syntrophus sp. (in: bacteria)]